ncbi:hypothetical protein J7J47_09635 [Halomonas sp. ISL-60]|uniref:hypothetical protein n=1 Tax=unclassified Halomonas TaxID=2609666 RepID=UPI0007D98D0C|nr:MULTISPECIES: hypothetical protein [unclassified Halomonas]MBT2772494.1 hypothetical protein [Halomonas sp. ISL-60]MBT2788581.1 hypothetical protein [Halomonas sp. ISL-106]MBT2798172.1 hypothetical protein [Halomonas sp. ISL-104]MBT2802696.1 hypothetical protein [Halomonas sp. ISL-56]OAL60723.1 hypothetical protein A6R74_18595 [Halomonas sp. ALS9]
MQSKYKIRLLRANLLAAAVALAFWTPATPPAAALVLWLSVGWLFITALMLDFSHRHSRGLPWQMVPGALLLSLIAAAPERHGILIWAWAAMLMLPQKNWVAAFNLSAGLISSVMVAPLLNGPTFILLICALLVLGLLALSRAQQLIDMNGSIRQRLRLIPGLNLWAGEQLLRDISREQTRCEREGVHAELFILHVKRHQLWPTAQKLCELTYDFENVYRLSSTTLVTLILARSPKEALRRRSLLLADLPDNITSEHLELIDIEPATLSVGEISKLPTERVQEPI